MFPTGIEIFGTARSNDMHRRPIPDEKVVQGMHIPKLRITIFDDGSLVQKRMFSALFTNLRFRGVVAWSCRYFMPDDRAVGIKLNASVSRCYHRVKNDRTNRISGAASRSDNWLRCLRRSKARRLQRPRMRCSILTATRTTLKI